MKKSLMASAIALALSGCGTLQQAVNAYGGVAINSAQQANDSYALAWSAAACGTTVGAAMRNPHVIPALRVLCMPPAGSSPSLLLDQMEEAQIRRVRGE